MCMGKIAVIGSGFSGLAAASCLAQDGFDVQLLEKNDRVGGRAGVWRADGFTFDMGPSWYWMPDVFERFFNRFGKSVSDYYQLHRLDPSYAVFFGKDDVVDIPANLSSLFDLVELMEKGAGNQLLKFLDEAKAKYEIGMRDLVYKPGLSWTEFADPRLMKNMLKMHVFRSFRSHIRKYFKHPRILQILEFPVLFLGALPENTPALYSLMNYADINLGTWYPMGGMYKIVEGMKSLAEEMGVEILTNQEVDRIQVANRKVSGLHVNGEFKEFETVLASADYHHVEQNLLDPEYRQYKPKYWDKRDMAPSSLIFYVGVDKKLEGLRHHNLFFDTDFDRHAKEIYGNAKWPTDPLFYVCAPSVTDPSVAPEGKENLFILMPLAPGLEDSEELREQYFDIVMDRIESITSQKIKEYVSVKRSYAMSDFQKDHHAFKGNAYGLANTLRQTAILKPRIKSKKVDSLYFAGQLTVPGPGVPPSLISGQISADLIAKQVRL